MAFCLCLFTLPAVAAPTSWIIGQIGGSCRAVAIGGNYAYIGEGPNLTILNISNPASPAFVGRVMLENLVRDVVVSGTKAYVALQESGIRIIDVSNPGAPKVLGGYVTPGQAWNLDVSGNYLYVAYDNISVGQNASGLLILNVSTPSAPALVKDLNTFDVSDVDVSGSYAFCVGGSYLRIIDITVPSSASLVKTVNLPSWGNARAIRVAGNYLYVCVDNASPTVGLQIYGISPDPLNPVELGHCDAAEQPYDVAILGSTALVANLNSGLKLISIANPNAPTLLGELDLTDQAVRVAGGGTRAFVADAHGGFQIVNVSVPASPVRDSIRAIATRPNGSRVIGTTAYVADGTQGLQFFDLSAAQNPVYRGRHAITGGGEPEDVDVYNGRAYVGGSYGIFEVVDVTNILSPVRLGGFTPPSWVSQVRVLGGYAYLACQSAGTAVLRINNPASISQVASLATPKSNGGSSSSAYAIELSGSTLYVGYGGGAEGMQVLNFNTSTQQLTETSHYSAYGPVYDIKVKNGIAYLACWNDGLETARLIANGTPEHLGAYGTSYAFQTALSGRYAIVANADDIQILDVGTPGSIIHKQTIDLPGAIQHVTGYGAGCLVSSREGGLYVIQLATSAEDWQLFE